MQCESGALRAMIARRTTQFTLRMDPELKAAAETGAMADRRSLASVIELLLIDYCKQRGLLTADGRLPKRRRKPQPQQ